MFTRMMKEAWRTGTMPKDCDENLLVPMYNKINISRMWKLVKIIHEMPREYVKNTINTKLTEEQKNCGSQGNNRQALVVKIRYFLGIF